MYKKIVSLLLCCIVAISFAACGGGNGNASSGTVKTDLNKLKNEIESAQLVASYSKGTPIEMLDCVHFGSYPQENDPNYKTPIEWLVIDKYPSERKALLVSKQIIDYRRFHETDSFVSWENSDLRKWLNNDFYNTAFGKNEQKQILEATISCFLYGRGYYDVNDKIFCLSKANKKGECLGDHFGKISVATSMTLYAWNKAKNGQLESYWLRDPNSYDKKYLYVRGDGSCHQQSAGFNGVRPALWVKY